jgi:hypothetical protein
MYDINLIRKKSITPGEMQKVSKIFKGSLIVFSFIILMMFLRSTSVFYRSLKYKSKKKTIGKTINDMINEYSIEEWGEEWVTFHRDIKLIQAVLDEKELWTGKLVELNRSLPEKMAVERISRDRETGNWAVRLVSLIEQEEGDYAPVKQFIERLEKNQAFKKGVKLESQQRISLEGTDVNTISIIIPKD